MRVLLNVLRKVIGYVAILIAIIWVLSDILLPLGGPEVYQHTIPSQCKVLSFWTTSMCLAEVFGRYLFVPLIGLIGYAILPKKNK